MRDNKGFGAIEVILLIVIGGLIGGTGWYVYTSQKATDKNLDSASSSLEQSSKNKQQAADEGADDETKDWLSFTSNNKFYSLKLPDGWKFAHQTDGDVLLGSCGGDTDCVYQAGVRATVEEVQGGRDGFTGFFIAIDDPVGQRNFDEIQKTGAFKAANVEGTAYFYEQVDEPDGLGLPKGSKQYSYYFEKDGKAVYASYSFTADQTSQQELVEKALSTLKLN